MISDGGDEILAFARLQARITDLTADSIEVGKSPSPAYKGGYLLLITPQGAPLDPNSPLFANVYFIYSYGTTEADAALLDAEARKALSGKFIQGLGRLNSTQGGQPGDQPGTGWPWVMGIYAARGI